MPKIVDHEKQRARVAEAAWRVISRDGMEEATVRNIAKEAGMSAGSMRHYFSTQSELLAFSMKFVSERIKERALAADTSGDPLQAMERLLLEALPMDKERRDETEVWFAFIAKAFTDKTLQPLSRRIHEELLHGMESIVAGLVKLSLAPESTDIKLEALRLHSLIDGMAMHSVMNPEALPPEKMRIIVRDHLRSLLKKA
ncbi:TetR family transcriptional regulator C-terminal domain-containing protein [Metabacillus sp. GX 13764]|uniref:TetR/AcrR family transcriptional regulator n=1 Tax=Metabacillus kandeliae TaxID=2900151 RepID=UPI001E3F9E01|nr:TetR family transcriptional regulator C-terminal domain-containing protein [Metabacillus kandeliae]MCD7035536.1 TetR family transcriptional regulator C-terminal domain-containing protein [Metabacillus kandeliae]